MPHETSTVVSTLAPITVPTADEKENDQEETPEYQPIYAYQVPQQSNVGSESIFLPDPFTFSSMKARSAKTDRRSNEAKGIACPFYVMYLTNLAMQQRPQKIDNDNANNKNPDATVAPTGSLSGTRKVPMNSRISTAYPKMQSNRRPVNSPISLNTFSTFEDEESLSSTTPFTNNKRPSAKTSTFENESSYLLRDILRTSSWHQAQA